MKSLWAAGVLLAFAAQAEHFSYNAGDITGTRTSSGITYTLHVTKGNLGTSYSFDTASGATTGSPGGMSISVSSGSATGSISFPEDALPTSNFTLSMNGKLIPPGGGNGPQPTWSASGRALAPFFIYPQKEKYIWLDDSTSFSANESANWYIDNVKVHTGTLLSIGSGGQWNPATNGVYNIRANSVSRQSQSDTAVLTVADISILNVDAATPTAAKANYRLYPGNISCTGSFIADGNTTIKDVSSNFYFTFNQNTITVSDDIILKVFSGQLPEKEFTFTITPRYLRSNEDKVFRVYIPIEGAGYRSIDWGNSVGFRKYTYSIPASGKLLCFYEQNAANSATTDSWINKMPLSNVDGVHHWGLQAQFSDESTGKGLTKVLQSLSPDWIVRGNDFYAEKVLGISMEGRISLGIYESSGWVLVDILYGNTITHELN